MPKIAFMRSKTNKIRLNKFKNYNSKIKAHAITKKLSSEENVRDVAAQRKTHKYTRTSENSIIPGHAGIIQV